MEANEFEKLAQQELSKFQAGRKKVRAKTKKATGIN